MLWKNRTTKSAIDQKKSVIDDNLQGARLWLSKTCPVTYTDVTQQIQDVQCVTLNSALHKTRSAKSRVCSWDGETALHGREFHFLQVTAQVRQLKGSAPPQELCVQKTHTKYQAESDSP